MPAPHDLADPAIPGLVADLEMGDRGFGPDLIRDRALRDGPVVEQGGGPPTPGSQRSAARRSRNAASAPRSTARARSASRSAVAAERGEDLGAKCVGQPVAGPVGDDAVEQAKGVVADGRRRGSLRPAA